MRFLKLGATALAGVFLATGAMAPALAQQPGAAQPVATVSKAMGPVFNEANAAIAAKDWTTARAKLDQVMTLTKTPQEKLAVEQTRVQVAANSEDWASLITAVKAIEALNLLPAADMKTYRAVVPESYRKLGDMPNYIASQKAYLDQYGGSHQDFARIAQDAMNANDTATSLTYIDKAIAAAKAGGSKSPELYYKIKAGATQKAGDTAGVYKVLEEMIPEYPKEEYWKQIIGRAQNEPGYGALTRFDMFRAMQAAGIKLTDQERGRAAAAAIERGLPNDALQMLEPIAGQLSGQDKDNYNDAKEQAPKDKAGLAADAASATSKGNTELMARIGEAYLSYGDNAKAADILKAALDKGIADAEKADSARLHLGIAQLRTGDKAGAKATWSVVKADNGAAILARAWTLIADVVV